MAKRLSLLLAAGMLIGAAALTPALADCVGDGTTSITCDATSDTDGDGVTAVDTNGTTGSAGDDEITINTDASIQTSTDAVTTGAGNDTVNIDGSIYTEDTVALGIRDSSGDLTVNGDGTVQTVGDYSDGISSGGNVEITGDLDIIINGYSSTGVSASGDVTISGDASITTTGTSWGVVANGDVNITGDANISTAGSAGVVAMNNVTITGDTDIFTNAAPAVAANENVTLDGNTTVEVINTDAAVLFGNQLDIGENVTVSNEAGIAIRTMDDGDQTVNNEGTINGDVLLGMGDDTFNALGGEVNGLIDGNAGTDTLTLDFDYTATSRDEFRDLRRALRGASAASGTITFGDVTYNWVNFEEFNNLVNLMLSLPPGPVVVTVETFVPLPRINGYDVAAPVAGFCVDGHGVAVYAIDAAGNGNFQGQASAVDIAAAVAAYAGSPVFLAGSDLAGLTLLDAETLLLTGPNYQFAFPANTCG